jgi:thioredoxin-like negative regulator of GroEL
MSHANLAMAMETLGNPIDQIQAFFGRALELDQDYIFARAGLARVLARRGDVEAAREMLQPVYSREQYHYSEWRTILLAQIEMALTEGNTTAVQAIQRALRDLEDMAA